MLASTPELIGAINGSPHYIGSIVAASATVVNNKTTAAPFSLNPGDVLLLVFTGSASWMLPATSQAQQQSTTGGVSASVPSDQPGCNPVLSTTGTNGVDRAVGDERLVILDTQEDLMQVAGNGGTATVKVFRLSNRR